MTYTIYWFAGFITRTNAKFSFSGGQMKRWCLSRLLGL